MRALSKVAAQLRKDGWTEERIARHLVDARNRLKIIARQADNPAVVAAIEARNLMKYGHLVGPSADYLYKRYGTWGAVIDAASRPAKLS